MMRAPMHLAKSSTVGAKNVQSLSVPLGDAARWGSLGKKISTEAKIVPLRGDNGMLLAYRP